MNILENIKIALRSIRSNFVRALLTLMIIAVGITCLVGILTAIDTVLFSMSDSFNRMGANSFYIYPARSGNTQDGKQVKKSPPIVFDEARKFKEDFEFPGCKVSINTFCKWNSTVKFKNKQTNPNIRLVGIDENYLSASSFELVAGRNFVESEIESGDHKIILGSELVTNLFNDDPSFALNQVVHVGNTRYKVVGVLEGKGSSMTNSNDRRIFIPLLNAKRYYGNSNRNYSLLSTVADPTKIDGAISSAIGVLRRVRKLKTTDKNNFDIRKSDGILQTLKEITTELRLATIAIAMMTLFGASIGLMNIMLVSVTERTKEIGVRKAIGATSYDIMLQFLIEAIVITILGGILGVLMGIGMGFVVAHLIDGKFIVPINWMALGIFVCIVVGTLSGLYPALKASRLDPIESLRYE